MKLRNKILIVLITILLLSGGVVTGIWYHTSAKLSNTYLENVSESSMRDAYHAFEYLLTDTSYMATMISANKHNIVEPVTALNTKELATNHQWNQTYLDNRRIILNYINSIDGYKYYISGISIAANKDCVFSANHNVPGNAELYEQIQKLDQNKLEKSVVMMEPLHMEGLKSTVSSDYVVPAVRAITNDKDEIIGYVIVYFDYGVIDKMFSANLPEGSYFQVVNANGALIYSNTDKSTSDLLKLKDGYVRNVFHADNVEWTFYMAIPSKYYVEGIQKTALLTGVVIALVILLAVFASAFLVSRMTAEITVLRDKMTEVSKGDLAVQYEVKENDEIGQMGATFNQMVRRISELMHRVTMEEEQKRKAEMAFLQAQIHPHFISNVLNNVVWMAKIQHANNIVPLVNSLNSLLRAVIHQENELICLKDELEYVDNYLTIMEYSGSFDFVVERHIEEETLLLNIPRFILQPIIENAIYHGLPNDLSRQGMLLLEANVRDGKLQIIVEDNGGGMTEEEINRILNEEKKDKKSFNGVGVTNVNERIKLCFGETYGIRYESEPGKFTRCIFMLPVVKGKEDTNGKNQIGYSR